MISRKRSKNAGDGGTSICTREGITPRVMVADRPYDEVYDFYSVSPELLDRPSYVLVLRHVLLFYLKVQTSLYFHNKIPW
jgi:hypothetical protein